MALPGRVQLIPEGEQLQEKVRERVWQVNGRILVAGRDAERRQRLFDGRCFRRGVRVKQSKATPANAPGVGSCTLLLFLRARNPCEEVDLERALPPSDPDASHELVVLRRFHRLVPQGIQRRPELLRTRRVQEQLELEEEIDVVGGARGGIRTPGPGARGAQELLAQHQPVPASDDQRNGAVERAVQRHQLALEQVGGHPKRYASRSGRSVSAISRSRFPPPASSR